MDGLTINEAAETTGWSPRMLRYLERVGLIQPPRTGSGYRVFGAGELQRLRTLPELPRGRLDRRLAELGAGEAPAPARAHRHFTDVNGGCMTTTSAATDFKVA